MDGAILLFFLIDASARSTGKGSDAIYVRLDVNSFATFVLEWVVQRFALRIVRNADSAAVGALLLRVLVTRAGQEPHVISQPV